ncbi:CHRD domain-containing protein [Nocardioides zeae]|uniref:CHRD domain-containing protein n=1 Tax=Nocardioides imazamoxiresistens TaxID=3231893 RepID=A0ABU3PRD3_9ACTN|nr:CHRD domain-containing protein [Nocardioides zeae]MDT9591789.1 CHRD domain-containing protein [Nocardioides zeae]
MSTTRPVLRLTALAGAAALTLAATAAPASAETEVPEPDSFTSAFTVMATPDTIINPDGEAVPGEEGATGTFTFRVNSDEEIICYDITLQGVTGEYESPAKTATHIHAAPAGQGGPPRIAFPNPEGDDSSRTSSGCLQGPFTTGVEADGADTGDGFTLADLEADPASFSADTHTAEFVAGAVRGQLTEIPVGGVDTGAGGLATTTEAAGTGATAAALTGVALLTVVGAAGAVALRRKA